MRTFVLAVLLCGCSTTKTVASLRETGVVPDPPKATGRDSGMSAQFGGHSVWLFGDTFFADAASDGYHWRSSSWSWTDDHGATWKHALDADEKPVQALPHTAEEQAFNDAHNGDKCTAQTECGARHTPWPMGSFVVDPKTGTAWVPYTVMETQPTGVWGFKSVGTGLAKWANVDAPAERPEQSLFGAGEPSPGAGGLVLDGALLFYSCQGNQNACILARVPLESAQQRSAWTFWNGSAWVADWHAAKTVFNAAPYVTVAFNARVNRYLAWYMTPLDNAIWVRKSESPQGPWSDAERIGTGEPSKDPKIWDYALVAHPELDRENGRVVTLSYFQPGTFLNGTVHLLEATLN